MAEWVRDLTALATAISIIAMAISNYLDRRSLRQRLEKQAQQTQQVVAAVEQVHKATNSLTDRLVATTEAEALARGGIEERARADERTAHTKPNS